ncbi:growth arrest-specific protein 2-like [Mytilus trossulus]|uniref:growth arrest-specific protein 2-like n=1 Tax=Mytilus trossulus TaxID=6551 RepID=UPI003006D559
MAASRHSFSTVKDNAFPPCKCYQYLSKKRSGQYFLMGKLLHIKVNEKSEKHHVMVKVGGGWETLEDYMDRHVPYKFKIAEYKRPLYSNTCEVKDIYLGIKSHYKSWNQSKQFYYSLF